MVAPKLKHVNNELYFFKFKSKATTLSREIRLAQDIVQHQGHHAHDGGLRAMR
jgi:hypothetical protein